MRKAHILWWDEFVKSDYEYLKKLVDNLIKLNQKLETLSKEEKQDFSSLNDYFLFLTLEGLEDKQKGMELFESYMRLGSYCKDKKNDSYEGFFFALSELLSLKHGIREGLELLAKEKFLSKAEWQKRFEITKERLNL